MLTHFIRFFNKRISKHTSAIYLYHLQDHDHLDVQVGQVDQVVISCQLVQLHQLLLSLL